MSVITIEGFADTNSTKEYKTTAGEAKGFDGSAGADTVPDNFLFDKENDAKAKPMGPMFVTINGVSTEDAKKLQDSEGPITIKSTVLGMGRKANEYTVERESTGKFVVQPQSVTVTAYRDPNSQNLDKSLAQVSFSVTNPDAEFTHVKDAQGAVKMVKFSFYV